jgi:hypothetical protein
MADYFINEYELTKELFNLDDVLNIQFENDIQVIRGNDYQYVCYINKIAYAEALTPMFALAYGIKKFKEKQKTTLQTKQQ